MNTEQFKHIIQNPWEISGEDLPDLERIISLFPYFEEARLLYLLALVRENDLRFPEELRKQIPFISNRKNLKKWVGEFKEDRNKIATTTTDSKPVIPHVAPTTSTKPIPIEPEEIGAVEEENSTALHPLITGENKLDETTDLTEKGGIAFPDSASEKAKLEEEIAPTEPPLAKEKKVQKHPLANLSNDIPADDFLEKLIISSAINNSIQSEVADPEEISDGPEEEDIQPIPGSSLGSWLRQTKKAQVKKPGMDLIDKFIETAPSKISIKRDFFSAEDLGKKSTVDAEELITETLLEIYLKQGDYEKVIRGYKKLALKFPEKKSYFAARIDGVKQIKNEKKK